MYKNGQGVAEDMTEAIACYKKGAELGTDCLSARAYNCQHIVETKPPCTTDSLPLDAGDPMAHLSLAVCYTHGKGVEESMLKAFEHHTEASKSGV